MSLATRIVWYQLAVGLGAGLLWWWVSGFDAALAAAAGGAASALISYYAALKALGRAHRDPGAMLSDFFRAQAWKYVMVAVVFVAAIKIFGHQFLPFITAYLATLSIYWFSLLWKE
ncbi:ATP synthase I chain [Hydrocarboniphaga daqingensis]|jgi:ATP synthase protein I|uniref:ATP synthase I chain n=1 Tax=Hydrocarboniphaga daqingensis TaxID=490188 RepID=A0A1M5MTK7_9GAMM|nr:ATP synthase subunit I [Hydrocarboniphaga daqingensis]SHG80586.1 ATP synthase I chain [Hydrocarboniphaga daqingensis]